MDIERYTMGSCHHLAVAMHRLTGWDLALVAGPMRGKVAVYHVFCLDPEGGAWDARGRHAVQDLLDEQEAMDGSETWPIRLGCEGDVWQMSRGTKPLLHPIHETFVRDAVDFAADVVGDAMPLVSDGWRAANEALVESGRRGILAPVRLDRAAAMPVPDAPPQLPVR